MSKIKPPWYSLNTELKEYKIYPNQGSIIQYSAKDFDNMAFIVNKT